MKRMLCIVLCVVLLCAAAAPAHAVAVVDDIALWGIASLLGSWGVTFAAQGATQSEITDTLRDLLDSAGAVVDGLTSAAATIAAPGVLKLKPVVYAAALQVAQYLRSAAGGSGSHGIVQAGNALTFSSGVSLPYVSGVQVGDSGYKYYALSGQPQPIFTSGQGAVFYDLGNGYTMECSQNGDTMNVYFLRNGSRYTWGGGTFVSSYPDAASMVLVEYNGRYYVMLWYQTYHGERVAWDRMNAGRGYQNYIPTEVFSTVSASGFSFDAVISDAASIPVEAEETPVYVGSPGANFTDVAALGQDFYDGITGEKAYPQTMVYPEQWEAENARDQVQTVTNPISVDDDYTVTGLASVFPFCIPFDLYDMFAALRANREAPCFDWRFYVPGLIDYTLTLDMAQWDTAAQILRTCELLAFCVGLALATKKLLGW